MFNDITSRENIVVASTGNTSFHFMLKSDSLVGDGSKAYSMTYTENAGGGEGHASIWGYFQNTPTRVPTT